MTKLAVCLAFYAASADVMSAGPFSQAVRANRILST